MSAPPPIPPPPYPLQLSIEPAVTHRNRLTVGLRVLWIIPIAIVLSAVSGGTWAWRPAEGSTVVVFAAAGGFLFWAPLLMLLFRQKYPRWWFDWNIALLRFSNRVGAYALLLRDEYPSTEEEQAVHLDVDYPDVKSLSSWLPLVKWLLAIPHYVVLGILSIGVVLAVIVAWIAILITGRYPAPLFDYVVGVGRWFLRVDAYAFLLVTDEYPPFSLG